MRVGGAGAELQVGASWRQLAAAGPRCWPARCDHAAVAAAEGEVQVLGGVNKGAWCYGDVWHSTDHGASWSPVPATEPGERWRERSGHAVVMLEEPHDPPRALLLGGVGKDQLFNDIWESSDGGKSWRELAARSPWRPRYGHRAVAAGGAGLVVAGGVAVGGFLADAWRSCDGGGSWRAAPREAVPWRPRAAHAMVRVCGASETLVLLAGMGEDGVLGDVWHSLDLGASWQLALAAAPWPARSGPAAAPLAGGQILLLGGFTGCTYLNDVWMSHDLGVSWTQVTASAPWLPRYCHACVAPAGRSVLLLGGHSEDRSLSDVWESPDRAELQRHASVALVLGRRLEVLRGISRETWCNRVMPYLLPMSAL